MYDVITIGSAMRDVFLISDDITVIKSAKSKTGAYECLPLGSKIEVDKLVLTSGGGATNAAATFASLGYKTAAVGSIGDDTPGRGLKEELKAHSIGTSLIKTVPGGQTGYSALVTTPKGERTVLVYRGVSAQMSAKDIPWSKLKTKWIYMTSLGGNLGLAKRIVNEAHQKNIQLAYNPGMAEIQKGWAAFKPLLPKLSLLMMNLEEAAELTGKKTREDIMRLFARYNLILVITDGANGSYAQLGDEVWFAKPTKVKPISRTGAGDAFGSAFVASIIKDDDLGQALQVATLNAESVIQSIGAKIGILKAFPTTTKRNKIKIKKI
ncbi:MAG: carbohydrate kinase family protein [Candidatus Uhrbacteria bacterium]|nr:carbohydrate kinase family protein [Patescibacteria group bacterium]MBU1906557.1 carbohydrate kinase family protein [Patescibacteria group bacterium]